MARNRAARRGAGLEGYWDVAAQTGNVADPDDSRQDAERGRVVPYLCSRVGLEASFVEDDVSVRPSGLVVNAARQGSLLVGTDHENAVDCGGLKFGESGDSNWGLAREAGRQGMTEGV